MTTPSDSLLLRIFVSEAARHGHQPLYEAIVLKAREARLAGATLSRPVDGKDITDLMLGKPGATTPHTAFFYYVANRLAAVCALAN